MVMAPFRFEHGKRGHSELVDRGYTVRQYVVEKVRSLARGRKYRLTSWWLWAYVQAENRVLSKKELELMNYGNPETNRAVSRSMDTVQDTLEREVCACAHTRKEHANGQGIQPAWITTACRKCVCPAFVMPLSRKKRKRNAKAALSAHRS